MKLNYFFSFSTAVFLLLFFFQASGQTVAITYVRDITTGTDTRTSGIPSAVRQIELRVKVSGVSSPVNVASAAALSFNVGNSSYPVYYTPVPITGEPAIWQVANWVNESSTQASFTIWVPINTVFDSGVMPVLGMRIGQGRKTGIFGSALEIVYATGSVSFPPLVVL
ncbi:hypothetical protein [Olivibacter domesticus]|uniref:Uncharacterized protein n=1 Tax=Olivibacter domesticus TaxID=407022 RepID=A0A1H7HYX5_OLID1|nr:hypothetical protein [Olivibacter domesticus]SEK55344.1 hypothetical protein SAMN05661044_00528 [Olivibacter domesticus]